MIITVKTPTPHSPQQAMVMNAFNTPGLLELWVANGTKNGKSIGASSAMSTKSWVTKNGLYRWVAPIYAQSKVGLRYCQRLLPPRPYVVPNKSEMSLSLMHQGTTLEFWHGQDAESLEGEAVNGYVLDEVAKMSSNIYDSALTTVTITRGPMICISTPRGKNWFYEKCMRAKEEMEWAIKRGQVPKRMFITAPSAENPKVLREAIDEARKNLPDRLFRQYYNAEFVDDGDVFGGFRNVLYGDRITTEGRIGFWILPDYPEDENRRADVEVVIGADWGKKNDYTVFTAWDIKKRKMIGFMRFRGSTYIHAIKCLIWFSARFRKVHMIRHDKTGLGEVIDEMLDKTELPFEGTIFTNYLKSEMVNGLMVAVEQRSVELPNWGEMVHEMDNYEVTTSEIGNMRYSSPAGLHDDIISSMILGWACAQEYMESDMAVRFVEDLPSRRPKQDPWVRQIQEELEDGHPGWYDIEKPKRFEIFPGIIPARG
jgi:hypothetical protein